MVSGHLHAHRDVTVGGVRTIRAPALPFVHAADCGATPMIAALSLDFTDASPILEMVTYPGWWPMISMPSSIPAATPSCATCCHARRLVLARSQYPQHSRPCLHEPGGGRLPGLYGAADWGMVEQACNQTGCEKITGAGAVAGKYDFGRMVGHAVRIDDLGTPTTIGDDNAAQHIPIQGASLLPEAISRKVRDVRA